MRHNSKIHFVIVIVVALAINGCAWWLGEPGDEEVSEAPAAAPAPAPETTPSYLPPPSPLDIPDDSPLEPGDDDDDDAKSVVAVDLLDPSCKNGIQDNAETDKDCGGPLCPGCQPGKKCIETSDCAGPDDITVHPYVGMEARCDNSVEFTDVNQNTQTIPVLGGQKICTSEEIFIAYAKLFIPHVVGKLPAPNEAEVILSPDIQVMFDINMDNTSVNTNTFQLHHMGTLIPSTVTPSSNPPPDNKRLFHLAPNAALEEGKTYSVTITGGDKGVKSNVDTPMVADVVWTFSTKPPDEPPPPPPPPPAGEPPLQGVDEPLPQDEPGPPQCDAAAGEVPSGDDCIIPLNGLTMNVRTSLHDSAQTGPPCRFTLKLCSSSDVCTFVATFMGGRTKGQVDTVVFTPNRDTSSHPHLQGKDLDALVYPDDFQYMEIINNECTDGWLISGIEFVGKLAEGENAGDDFVTYRNPLLNRWIDFEKIESESGIDPSLLAEGFGVTMTLEDDAYGLTMEICDHKRAGSDAAIWMWLPVKNGEELPEGWGGRRNDSALEPRFYRTGDNLGGSGLKTLAIPTFWWGGGDAGRLALFGLERSL